MKKLKDSIVFNGKVYAVNGNAVMAPVFPIDIVKTNPLTGMVHARKKPQHHNQVVKNNKKTHEAPHHLNAHKRQHSQTLMRSGVKNPVKAQMAEKPVKPTDEPQNISRLPNAGRIKRAIETPKSLHISRFSHNHHAVHVKRSVALEVKAAPSISSQSQPDELDSLIKSLAAG